MPTIFSHTAVPLAIALGLGPTVVSRRLLVAGIAASVLPDLDVVAFRFGIEYANEFGHRGASHSLVFATVLGTLAALLSSQLRAPRIVAFAFVLVAAASHGLLDMLTNGGLGVDLFWPLSQERVFFPFQVIEVSPLNLRRLFSPSGAAVLMSEWLWVWMPSAMLGLAIHAVRRMGSRWPAPPKSF